MTICAGGKHHDTNVTYPCDFRVVEKAELPHGCSIALTHHHGTFMIEVVANRVKDGKPWYPSVDSAFGEREDGARLAFAEMKDRWVKADRDDIEDRIDDS